MKLLALDTATQRCSAALWLDGVVSTSAVSLPRGHGELLLPMIDALLGAAAQTLAGLDAIAFGRGPGAFTGLRLAASVAQGLAFAAGLPVLPVSDLAAVAQQALAADPHGAARVLVCQDARMGEVYWGLFGRDGDGDGDGVVALGPERVDPPPAVALPADAPGIKPGVAGTDGARMAWIGAGSGFEAYPQLLAALGGRLQAVQGGALPDAAAIARLAARAGLAAAVPAAQAQPVYLRDQVAVPPAAQRLRGGHDVT